MENAQCVKHDVRRGGSVTPGPWAHPGPRPKLEDSPASVYKEAATPSEEEGEETENRVYPLRRRLPHGGVI
jgi:hypothetical protein